MTFETQAFQTAARTRRGKPLAFTIEHTTYDDETGEPSDVEYQFRVDPKLDVIRFGTAVGGFSQALQGIDKPETSVEDKLAALDRETPKVREAMRFCLVPHDRAKWDEIAEDVDIRTLGDLLRWVSRELSGQNPTSRTSSSDGSASTGSASTGGALPAPSISDASPSPVP